MKRTLIKFTRTKRFGLNGESVFRTNCGPYKYATFNEDIIEIKDKLEKVKVISWCSRDGEPIKPINPNLYDVSDVTGRENN